MRVVIFVSSIVFVVVAVAALPLSAPAEAVTSSHSSFSQDAYGR